MAMTHSQDSCQFPIYCLCPLNYIHITIFYNYNGASVFGSVTFFRPCMAEAPLPSDDVAVAPPKADDDASPTADPVTPCRICRALLNNESVSDETDDAREPLQDGRCPLCGGLFTIHLSPWAAERMVAAARLFDGDVGRFSISLSLPDTLHLAFFLARRQHQQVWSHIHGTAPMLLFGVRFDTFRELWFCPLTRHMRPYVGPTIVPRRTSFPSTKRGLPKTC